MIMFRPIPGNWLLLTRYSFPYSWCYLPRYIWTNSFWKRSNKFKFFILRDVVISAVCCGLTSYIFTFIYADKRMLEFLGSHLWFWTLDHRVEIVSQLDSEVRFWVRYVVPRGSWQCEDIITGRCQRRRFGIGAYEPMFTMRALNDSNEPVHCKHQLKCSKASSLLSVTEEGRFQMACWELW